MFPHRLGLIVSLCTFVASAFAEGDAVCSKSAGQDPSCTKKLLKRPAHNMPDSTWQLQDSDSIQSIASKGPLTNEQVEAFYKDGFLVLEDFYPATALREVQVDVEHQIDVLTKDLFAAGKIKSLYEDQDWTARLNLVRKEHPDAPVLLTKRGVLPSSLQRIFAEPRILDVASQLGVGPDIAVNAAWNLRAKVRAHEETVVPWHQDNSYWEPRIWDENILTIWLSLVDATRDDGCLQFVRGGHRSGKVANHTIGSTTTTWYTESTEGTIAQELLGKEELEEGVDIVTVETKAGTVVIFPGTTPHRSLNSASDNIRWSADWRLHRKVAKRAGQSDLDWFYGLKDSFILREDPAVNVNYRPDWSAWANAERTAAQDVSHGIDADKAKMDLDPIIVGPWMDLWDLEEDRQGRRNPHLERYMQGPAEARDPKKYISKGHW